MAVGVGIKLDTLIPDEPEADEELALGKAALLPPAGVEDEDGTSDLTDYPLDSLKIKKVQGEPVWSDTPQFAEQFRNPKFARSVEKGPLITEVYDLAKPEDREAWNKLRAGADPLGSPRVTELKHQMQWDANAGNWKILAEFRRVRYKQIVVIAKQTEAQDD